MEQLKGVVRQSVEMAQELQASAEGLYQQSDSLNGVVGRFKTGEDRMAAHTADAPPLGIRAHAPAQSYNGNGSHAH
jgi:hypothetical protein